MEANFGLMKDPIVTATNGAHDSSKDVVLEAEKNVSDLKETSILTKKENSPAITKEFSPLPDRKDLSLVPPVKEDSPIPSSKETSPLPLSKEPSPLPARKESPIPTKIMDEPIISKSKESSPLLEPKEENTLLANKELSPLPSPIELISVDKSAKSGTEAFLLSETIGISEQPPVKDEPLIPSIINEIKETATVSSSLESKVFPPSSMSEPLIPEKKHEDLVDILQPVKKEIEEDNFGFNKPLPPEPIESATADFLKSELTDSISKEDDDSEMMKPMTAPKVDITTSDDFLMTDKIEDGKPKIVEDEEIKTAEESVTPRKASPSPPPVPKHQYLRDNSSERYEPSQTPEPDFAAFKPVLSNNGIDDKFDETVKISEPVTVPEPIISTSPKQEEKPKPQVQPTKLVCSLPKNVTEAIGTKDIRSKIDAWFNPARLHPQVESLIYWRDPKKSGIVFGIVMVSLLSLIYYSLISVTAYLCLFTLFGTITFRVYKNIMQAVQKTSDGHPFKEFLEIDLTIPEDKVNEVSQCLVQYLNVSLTTLRSLFLVEDLIDSIKFVIILWVLTYVGACFNGLTLIIIGVILLFSLPKIYENNKTQIDIYIKMATDKLSIITSRMKAAVPEDKKDEKPKDQ